MFYIILHFTLNNAIIIVTPSGEYFKGVFCLFRKKNYTPEELTQIISDKSNQKEAKRLKAASKTCDKITCHMARYKVSAVRVNFYRSRKNKRKGNIMNIHVTSMAIQVAACETLRQRGFHVVDNNDGILEGTYTVSVPKYSINL